MSEELRERTNFIWEFIEQDLAAGKNDGRVRTRFPPEPNGYLHIGHVKALIADFSTAERFGGTCNLRFDDTNPTKEDVEYVEAIIDDIHWLGFEYENLFYASEQYEQIFDFAVDLIKRGLAYVDDLSQEEMRTYRGTLTEPGKNSPYRERSVEENMDLFLRMRAGEFAEGTRVLRAKIDMAAPNIIMRDPTLYRILYKHHHRTGDAWCIYPMYDFAHPIGDALEGITHSLCSLEYEIHRPLYDWVTEVCNFENPPRQIEFARLNLTNTIMSKRYLRRLVEEGYVSGWDDPRMPTLVGMRRRGYTANAIREFIDKVGVSKADSIVDLRFLEFCVRGDLNNTAARAMAVLDPLKVVLTNWPEGEIDTLTLENHPNVPEMGTHTAPFTRELYIEREDFMIDPPKKFFRLAPEREVRLKGAYIIKCESYDVDEDGNPTCVYCSVDIDSKSGSQGSARKVKGTLHWVSASAGIPIEVKLFDVLMLDEDSSITEADEDPGMEDAAPEIKKDFISRLNPNSVTTVKGIAEPYLASAQVGDKFQFLRVGYFCKDKSSTADSLVFNRTVALKDSYKPE